MLNCQKVDQKDQQEDQKRKDVYSGFKHEKLNVLRHCAAYCVAYAGEVKTLPDSQKKTIRRNI